MKFSKSSQLLNAHKSTKEENGCLPLISGDKNINLYTNEQLTGYKKMGTPTTSNHPIQLGRSSTPVDN